MMVGGINFHRACTALGLNCFNERELSGWIHVSDGDGAVAAGRKGESGAGIEAIGIDALADWHSVEDFSGIAVDEGHELVVAANDQDFAFRVDGQAGRRPQLDGRAPSPEFRSLLLSAPR